MTALDVTATEDEARDWSDDEAEPSTLETNLAFVIDGQIFAVDVRCVREVLDLRPIIRLPNAPHDLLGVIDLRGQAITVLDLAGRLGLATPEGDERRIVVLDMKRGGRPVSVGLVAERVLRVFEVEQDQIEPVPESMGGWSCGSARGLVRLEGEMTVLLDLAAVFGDGAGASDEFDFS